jgi:hypothetical protein
MRGRGLRRACAAAIAVGLALGVGSARSATHDSSCTWGASSITAQYVGGKLVESQPVTTGCTP